MPKLNSFKKEEFKKLFLSDFYNMSKLFTECSSLEYLPNIANGI